MSASDKKSFRNLEQITSGFSIPARMNAKAAFHLDPAGEIERAKKEGRMPKWPLRM